MSAPGYFYHKSWPVLYEDNHLLVLYKPAGLLVQGDETGDASLLDLGKAWIGMHFGKPGRVFLAMVHRLDRPVAGVVLFCRTSKAAARLSEQFRSGRVEKRYLAVVEGRMKESSGRLIHHIERHGTRSSLVRPGPTGSSREARLSYRVQDSAGDRALVRVILETGRHHQIRVQLAHIGHPILGDLRYGAQAALDRRQLALLAHELMVHHPTRGTSMVFRSPIPLGWPWPLDKTNVPAPPWSWEDLRGADPRLGPLWKEPCSTRESVKE